MRAGSLPRPSIVNASGRRFSTSARLSPSDHPSSAKPSAIRMRRRRLSSLIRDEDVQQRLARRRLVPLGEQRLGGGVAHAHVHVGEVGGHQRRHARALDPGQVRQQLDLLGGVALVARLVALHHLGEHVDDLVLGRHHLVEHAQRPGDRLSRQQVLLERLQNRLRPFRPGCRTGIPSPARRRSSCRRSCRSGA